MKYWQSQYPAMQDHGVVVHASKPPLLRRRRSSDCKTVRILLLGQDSVGKSALAVRFATNRYIGEYDRHLESKCVRGLTVDDDLVTFEVMDPCTQGTGVTLNDDHIKWADGYMFVYDVTRPNTLYACESYRELLCDTRKAVTVPLMIIGNKTDLWPARQVTKEQGELLASHIGCPFVELSVSEGFGEVQDAFVNLYREIRSHRAGVRGILERIFKTRKK